MRTSDPFVPNEVRYQAAPITECGRILLLRRTPVNPLVAKYNSIGEKVGRQPTSRRLSAHQEYGTSCCSG